MKTKNPTLFSNEDWKDLKTSLNHLRAVCLPPFQAIRPVITFKTQADFQWDDALKWGCGSYSIPPSELKDIWENKATLNASDVDFIMVEGQKWFFNTHDKIGNFFLQDGTRKVEIEFPYWMEMGKVFKTPGVRSAVFNVLSQCMSPVFPDEKKLQNSFSENLCFDIYCKNPSRDATELAILEILEKLRTKTVEYLEKNHSADIALERSFKKYLKSRVFPVNTPEKQQVKEFLTGDKKAMYRLAEKYGIIKNADNIFKYEDIRNHIRHPDEVSEHPIKPDKVYKDFCLALNETITSNSKAYRLSRFGNNIVIAQQLTCLNFIWNILDQHVAPELQKKKNKSTYYDDLVEKGLLTPKEVSVIRSSRLVCNAIAHSNGFIKNARHKVMHYKELFNLVCLLSQRHQNIRR
ncbi:MAG: hypothetical protein E7013_02460 [Alphaproteobacteria bacterium]|nr:hypothetical protein [Alphaproteobacteria bacterium]